MTVQELRDLLANQPPDAEVVFKFTTTDGDGDRTTVEHGSGTDPDEHEIIHGHCGRQAGYQEHFKTPDELTGWMNNYAQGRSVRNAGWCPAIQLHIKSRTNW